MRLPWVTKSDVSGEKRDASGQWTAGGSSAVARHRETHEVPLKEHIASQRRIAGHDDAASHKALHESAKVLAAAAPKLFKLESLTDPNSIEHSRKPSHIEKIVADKRRPLAVRQAAEAYLHAREAVHHALRHKYSSGHEQAVEAALKSGKHVTPEVIADYPQLAEKYGVRGVVRAGDFDSPLRQVRDVEQVKGMVGPWVTKSVAFDESKHKRDAGKFSSTGGSRGKKAKKPAKAAGKPAAASRPLPPAERPTTDNPRPNAALDEAFGMESNAPAKPAAAPPPLPQRPQPPALPHERTKATALEHLNAVQTASRNGDRAGVARASVKAKAALQSHLQAGLAAIDRMAAHKYAGNDAARIHAATKAKAAFRQKINVVSERLRNYAHGQGGRAVSGTVIDTRRIGVGKSFGGVWGPAFDLAIGDMT